MTHEEIAALPRRSVVVWVDQAALAGARLRTG
jgi:hypothetical protein